MENEKIKLSPFMKNKEKKEEEKSFSQSRTYISPMERKKS